MKIIDAKGLRCPQPLLMTRKVFGEIKDKESVKIIIDSENACNSITHFLEDNGMKVNSQKDGNVYELIVPEARKITEAAAEEQVCREEIVQTGNYAVAIFKNRLGEGSEELGMLLIKALINTLPDTTRKPRTMIFMNSGIFLVLKNSPVLEALKKLEQSGVEILACGTCLDYFQKKEELGVGRVSTMYEILERLSQASNVLYP